MAPRGWSFPRCSCRAGRTGCSRQQRSMDESGLKGLEEERRLAYVGITRAERLCTISFAANRRVYGQWQSALPSRFIDELPAEHVEVLTPPGLYGGGYGAAAAPAVAVRRSRSGRRGPMSTTRRAGSGCRPAPPGAADGAAGGGAQHRHRRRRGAGLRDRRPGVPPEIRLWRGHRRSRATSWISSSTRPGAKKIVAKFVVAAAGGGRRAVLIGRPGSDRRASSRAISAGAVVVRWHPSGGAAAMPGCRPAMYEEQRCGLKDRGVVRDAAGRQWRDRGDPVEGRGDPREEVGIAAVCQAAIGRRQPGSHLARRRPGGGGRRRSLPGPDLGGGGPVVYLARRRPGGGGRRRSLPGPDLGGGGPVVYLARRRPGGGGRRRSLPGPDLGGGGPVVQLARRSPGGGGDRRCPPGPDLGGGGPEVCSCAATPGRRWAPPQSCRTQSGRRRSGSPVFTRGPKAASVICRRRPPSRSKRSASGGCPGRRVRGSTAGPVPPGSADTGGSGRSAGRHGLQRGKSGAGAHLGGVGGVQGRGHLSCLGFGLVASQRVPLLEPVSAKIGNAASAQ